MPSVSKPVTGNTVGVASTVPFPFPSWVEALFLLLLPVLTFWFFNLCPTNQAGSLDPWFYTGYINNAQDMLKRFELPYYAVRFGLILPGRFFTWALGSEPGYFAFRYALVLLGGIPLYILAKRKFSPPVAILTYCSLVFSPWFQRTLLWDHPDATGVPYLMAAMCLLLLASTPSWLRDGMAGCCVSLAINSNVFTGVIFGIFCAVYVAFAVLYGFGRRTLLTRAVMFTAGFTLVAAGGYAYYWHVFGEPRNIFRPTFEMASHLSRGGMKVYRVAGYQWLYNRFDVMVPVLLALCCLAISVRRHTRFEVAVCAASGTNVIAFFFVHQFLLEGDTLQLPYYTSYAIPTTFLMLICIGQSLWERFGGRAWVFLTVSLTATLTPLLLISAGVFWIAQFKAPAWAVMAVVTLAIVFSAGVQWRGRVLRITLAVSSLAMLALSMAAGLFVTYHVIRPFSSRDDNEIIVYRVALQLIKEAPKLSDGPGRLIFWYNDREQNPIRSVQSTFLWSISKMNQSPPEGLGMPNLGPFQMLQLRNYDVRYLVLLGERPEEVQAGLQAITRAKVGYDLLATRDLHSGTFHVYFQLIELTTRPPEPGEAAPK